MSKPTYEDLMQQRNDARAEADKLRDELEALRAQAAAAPTDGMADAVARVEALEAENAALREALANATPAHRDTGKAPAEFYVGNAADVPDTDLADPRPPFDPSLGWQTPAVLDWAARQRQKAAQTQPAE